VSPSDGAAGAKEMFCWPSSVAAVGFVWAVQTAMAHWTCRQSMAVVPDVKVLDGLTDVVKPPLATDMTHEALGVLA
jgi:hypothetical protein